MSASPSTRDFRQPRYRGIAIQLPKLPPEVVHKIINDVSIQKLLEIACSYDLPYIDQCICSHFHLRKIFRQETFKDVKTCFLGYLRLRSLDPYYPHPRLLSLQVDAVQFCEKHKERPDIVVVNIIKFAVLDELRKYVLSFPLLKHHASRDVPEPRFWDAMSGVGMVEIFEVLDGAEARLNSIKVEQLKRMVKLVQDYPGMLRTRDNRSQEPVRNEQHIVRMLLETAKMVGRRHILSGRRKGSAVFSSPYLFLCPYNRTLWLFLKTTEKYPPDIEEQNKELVNRHSYPNEMVIVLQGFGCIYPRNSPDDKERKRLENSPRYRTQHTKYAEPGLKTCGGFDQPTFAGLSLTPDERPLIESSLPAAEKEMEWLSAFLKVCQYMAGMKEQWKKGQTVGEHWRYYYPHLCSTDLEN